MKLTTVLLTLLLIAGGCQSRKSSERFEQIIPDVVYGHKYGMALTLDIYNPVEPNGASVVFVNSSGYGSPGHLFHTQRNDSLFLVQDPELEGTHVERLLGAGFTVFDVRHGSSPKFILPEIVEDMHKAVRFVKSKVETMGLDSDRIGIFGRSAGGHLALLMASSAELAPDGSMAEDSTRFAAVVAWYPPTEIKSEREAVEKYLLDRNRNLIEAYPAMNYPLELDDSLSPISYVSNDDPPSLIIHGTADRLVPLRQGQIMHNALLEAGVESSLMVVEGAGHGFYDEDAIAANDSMVTWFKTHLN